MKKIHFNFNKSNKIYCFLATVFYIGYCFVGYSNELFIDQSIFQYWLNSALFVDGKMLIALGILSFPYIKAFIEGTFLNNRNILQLFK